MKSIEFYITPKGDVMVSKESGVTKTLSQSDNDLLNKLEETISEFYPEAYEALCAQYKDCSKNPPYHRFLIVRRFIKCNWGEYDRTLDIDHLGRMNFEFVNCPLRGECKYDQVICCPKFNTALSPREKQVMELVYDGLSDDQIASQLFISLNTVNNHRKNSFKKTEVHTIGDFIIYAKDNNIFNK